MNNFELEANFQVSLKIYLLGQVIKNPCYFFSSVQNKWHLDPLHYHTVSFPSLVRYNNVVMVMLRINYLVWQSKKYVQLNFMVLLQRGRNSEGKQHLPRLEK